MIFVAKLHNFELETMKDEAAYLAKVSQRGLNRLQPKF